MLEPRENPSSLFYRPQEVSPGVYSTDGDNPLNYRDVAAPNPTLAQVLASPTAAATPGIGDHVYLRADVANTNVVFVGQYGVPRHLAGLHAIGGYGAEAEVRGSAFIGVLEMAGAPTARIRQNDQAELALHGNAGQITVSLLFTWTNGTLNNGPVAGLLNLGVGATGTATPNGGTVGLGSTLTLLGDVSGLGSVLDLFKGTYNLLRGDGLVVNDHAKINLKAEPGLTGKLVVDGKNKDLPTPSVHVKKGGEAVVSSVNRGPNDKTFAQVEINGKEHFDGMFLNDGNTTIKDYSELLITPPVGKPGGYYQLDAAATTFLEAGSKITCAGKAWLNIEEGRFEVKVRKNAEGQVVDEKFAYIAAPDTLVYALSLGKNTVFTMPDGGKFLTLEIDGDFFSQGEVRLALHRGADDADRIIAKKEAKLDKDDAKLILRWNPETDPPRPPGEIWNLISTTAQNGIVRAAPTQTTVPKKPDGTDAVLVQRNAGNQILQAKML